MRALEIIGEAASKVSEATRQQYPELAWKSIIGMRNRIVHDYVNIDLDIVWKTTITWLPELISELEKLLPPEKDQGD